MVVSLPIQFNSYSPKNGVTDKNRSIKSGSCEQSRPARDTVEVCVPEESGPIESEAVSGVCTCIT